MSHSNLRQWMLFIAWLITLTSLLTSLYGSNVLSVPVCHLCWYQRICMYPLVLILGIAIFRDDKNIAVYGIPLASIGAIFAIYQYAQQMIPNFSPIGICGTGPDCSQIHLKFFGFITYPLLAFLAFAAIIVLLAFSKKNVQN